MATGPKIDTAAAANFSVRSVVESDRYRELDRRQQYYDCTQHDWKRFDFDGRLQRPGPSVGQQPFMASEQSSWYVPLRLRRPSNPYRLARTIVNAFTTMVFGEKRFPSMRVEGDDATQDFAEALVKAAGLSVKMIQARNLGGAVGTVGLSWCYADGLPRVQVHNGKHLHVVEWADRDNLVPSYVVEVYRYPKDEWDQQKRKLVRNWYWFRRDWTPDEDVVYQDVKLDRANEPQWQRDPARTVRHDDGACHLVWVQNVPTDDVDGLPDYDGLYDNLDTIDVLASVLARGTTLNLDPTLVLKMDADVFQRFGVKKGSDNALVLGTSGAAEYLELGGQSVTAGVSLLDSMRRSILEVAQCIVPDPNTLAASGSSSVAMKVIYAPMIQRAEQMREQYGRALQQLVEQMLTVARRHASTTVVVPGEQDGEPDQEVQYTLKLPPKVLRDPVVDEQGKPTGESTVRLQERHPGEAESIQLVWGPYFEPTPDDQQKAVTTLQLATGAKAFMAPQTAVDLMAAAFGRDPNEEWRRLTTAQQTEQAAQAAMFDTDAAGGAVGDPNALPPGATDVPAGAQPAGGTAVPTVSLTSTDMAAIVKVNEARAAQGLGPMLNANGQPDPDGNLTVAEYKAKRAAMIEAIAIAEKGQPPGAAPQSALPSPGGGKPFGK